MNQLHLLAQLHDYWSVVLTFTDLIKNAVPITVWLIEAGYLIHILCQGQIVVRKEV